jgi:Flp pilus assembly protein TadB
LSTIHKINNIYFSLISITGLILLLVLVYYSPNQSIIHSNQKHLILSLFIVICILGMIAAVSPSRCSEIIILKRKQKTNRIDNEKEDIKMKFKGHHPECNDFNNHRYSLLGRTYCAGCSGLFIGAFISVVGTIIYNFYGIDAIGSLIFVIGFMAVLIYLLQDLILNINLNIMKFFFNMILVLGSFMLLIGIVYLKKSISVQLFFLVLVFIWILTRITSSEKKHYKICNECKKESYCIYR